MFPQNCIKACAMNCSMKQGEHNCIGMCWLFFRKANLQTSDSIECRHKCLGLETTQFMILHWKQQKYVWPFVPIPGCRYTFALPGADVAALLLNPTKFSPIAAVVCFYSVDSSGNFHFTHTIWHICRWGWLYSKIL